MTKKIISILTVLTLIMGLTAAFSFESSAAGIVNIYESATDPVIDGSIDSGVYRFVCATGDDPTGNLKTWEGCTVKDDMEFWACWKGDYLYVAIKVACDDPHVAYDSWTNSGIEHFIFNAHHMMTCIVPGDPYQDAYTGDNEDGSWSWTELSKASYAWEWTIINPSQESDTDICDHFRNMSIQDGFEFKVVTANGFDIYEQKIPLSKVVNSVSSGGIKAEVGSLFGFGFQMGLTDWGEGYTDETYQDYVYYSDYFTGAKDIHGMAYCKLASDLVKDPNTNTSEPEAPTAIDEPCDIFPVVDGNWTKTDHEGASVNIEYSQGVTVVSGSTSNTWPSATANFPKTVYLGEGTYLVYDLSVDTGATSILFNGTQVQGLFEGSSIDDNSGDLYAGTYTGAVSYEQLKEKFGADENGLVAINSIQVYSVNGATVTFNTFKFDPTYVPTETPDVSVDDEVSVNDESVNDESVADDSKAPVTESSAEVSEGEDNEGGNLPLILGIVGGVVAIAVVIVIIIVISKKKK